MKITNNKPIDPAVIIRASDEALEAALPFAEMTVKVAKRQGVGEDDLEALRAGLSKIRAVRDMIKEYENEKE